MYISGAQTAKKAWDMLVQIYQPSRVFAYIIAYRKFFQTRCPEGGDIAEHLRLMHTLRDEIHTIAGGVRISNNDFAFALLSSLPDLWDQFIQAFDATADCLSSAQVTACILQKEKH
jgi:hypothetical protein